MKHFRKGSCPSLFSIWSGVILLALFWGSSWLAIKLGLKDVSPFSSAAPRFLLSTGALYFYLKLKGYRFPRKLQFWRQMFSLALFMFIIPYGLVYWAEVYISSGLASILFSTQTLFVVAFAHFILTGEKASFRKWLGLFPGLIGLFLIFQDQIRWVDQWGFAGMIGVLIAAASGGFALVWLRRKGESVDPVPEVTAQLGITAVTFSILGFFFEGPQGNWLSLRLWIGIVYLGLFGTALAFVIYYWLAKHTSALITSFSIYASPVFAVFLGWIVLGETMDVKGLAGAAMVMISILVTQR